MRLPAHGGSESNPPVVSIGNPYARSLVYSTGRTSGLQTGQVCLSPMLVSGNMNETGLTTREWYVKEPEPLGDYYEWTRGGIGVSGDSGAVIVDCRTNSLLGQLWGRNKYSKEPGPRYTFFTPTHDIFDDIEGKYPEYDRPWLPHIAIPEIEILNDVSTPIPELGSSENLTPASTNLSTPRSIRSPEYFREALSNHYADIALASTPGILLAATPYAQEIDSDDLVDDEQDMAHKSDKRKAFEEAANYARCEKRQKLSQGCQQPDASD